MLPKKKIPPKKFKEVSEFLKENGRVLDPNSKDPLITLAVNFFKVGSLSHLADKESYYSYLGAMAIAQDLSTVKRDEVFGVWDNEGNKLYALVYRGEFFIREAEENIK